jgi:hypothetical protein
MLDVSQIQQDKPEEILDDFFKYLPEKERVEFKVFPHFYEMELNKTRQELTDMLYKLKDELHPQISNTTGHDGVLNDLDWLVKNTKYFNNFEKKKEDERGNHRMYMARLDQLSTRLSGTLFGEFADEPYQNDLTYTIASDTFRKIGLHSYTRTDNDNNQKNLYVDLSKLGLGMHAYTFVPWTSGLDISVGKPIREYYLDKDLHVEMGLKPIIFRLLSSAVTIPVHEIIHHISSMYNRDAYSQSFTKIFNESFKEIPNIFSLSHDKGTLFGSIDKKLENKGFDIRGKDLSDPFIFWDIVKKHGIKISDAADIPLNKLYEGSFNYLSRTLPFRILEEGVASYLSIENASIEKPPSEFSGLDNSLKNLVKFGAKLEKLNYLERKIDFFIGKNELADYYIPERQIYPVSYLYISYQAGEQNPTSAKWYFDLIKNNFLKRNVSIPIYQRTIETKKREDLNPMLAYQRRIESRLQQIENNTNLQLQRISNENKRNWEQVNTKIDDCTQELRDRLNRSENSSSRFDFPDVHYRPHRSVLGGRSRNNELSLSTEIERAIGHPSIRREIRNDDLIKSLVYAVTIGVIGYTASQVLRRYLSS